MSEELKSAVDRLAAALDRVPEVHKADAEAVTMAYAAGVSQGIDIAQGREKYNAGAD